MRISSLKAHIPASAMIAIAATVVLGGITIAQAAAPKQGQTKREETFKFAEKPKLVRKGNNVTITFATKGFCDVTVAVEDEGKKVIRHLASGVLGKNAPTPFQKGSLKQTIVWDGKDDAGKYVDDIEGTVIRVSLGLRARFERTLFWSPKKRTRAIKYLQYGSILAASPEGVYAYDGGNCEHIRLFDHNGDYVRTVFPPPADKLKAFQGLVWRKFPQSGQTLPLKWGLPMNTFLTTNNLGDTSKWPNRAAGGVDGMLVSGKRMFLSGRRLNMLNTDGTTGGKPLHGPELWFTVKLGRMHEYKGGTEKLPPESMAVSPDGKYLYMTGYFYTRSWHQGGLNGVARMPADGSKRPEPFLGHLKQGDPGKGNGQFHGAASVAVDKEGRLYVADYGNDRVQIFDAAGKHLENIKLAKPALVQVSPKNGEIYVFSWSVPHKRHGKGTKPNLTKLGSFKDPKVLAKYPLDIQSPTLDGHACHAAVDFWASPTTIWISESPCQASYRTANLKRSGIRLYVEKGGKLSLKRDFYKEATKEVVFTRGSRHMKQRLFFDHKNEKLFVGELWDPMPIHCTSIADVARIDPKNGKTKWITLPFDCEDMAFDMHGHAYLRTENRVARYDARIWREVPFDYGEEFDGVTTHGVRKANVVSGLSFVGHFESSSQLGGMSVSPKGHVIVTVVNGEKPPSRKGTKNISSVTTRKYTPQMYPGRARPWEVHVWDKHGKLLYEDAVSSVGRLVGIGMDVNDDLYFAVAGNGKVGEEYYKNPIACTYIKTKPKSRFRASKAKIPLSGENRPKRAADVKSADFAGDIWAEDAHWLRGGVCIDGKRFKCHCPSQSRFALDYFARSFLPEVDHYSVLVLDPNGNEIIRIGKYGNVDDGKPLEKKGGPPKPRSIGGDEVALYHAQMLAVHSDRRLFISDLGNARIASVKLDYNKEETVKLEDAKEE